MTVLAVAKVSKKYRITLPIEVRDFLNVTEGSNLIFFTVEGMKGRGLYKKGLTTIIPLMQLYSLMSWPSLIG